MEQNTFSDNLEKLVELFKRFRSHVSPETLKGIDPAFLKSLDLLINNYSVIKNNLPKEMLEEVGEPVKRMLADLLEQMKRELGEEDAAKPMVQEDIRDIDDLLKSRVLSHEDIDTLLDKRSEIMSKK